VRTPSASPVILRAESSVFGATPVGSEPREQLPAVVPPQFAAPAPVSGRWPIRCIALAVHLVAAVKLSLRAAPRVLTAVFGFLSGSAAGRMMAWTTVRGWLMRLGWYALHRTLERAGDWAYLIDHTVQIGVVKCFAVVGIQLSRLPYPARCLQFEDLTLIALEPMPHSSAATVEKALEEAALRTGVPRLIVSDEGTDVRGGIERYRDAHHDQTVATCDLAHKGANLLRKLLEADELWPGYAARLGTTKAKLQQTSLACFASPTLRPKARFMNLAAPLRWARWCLRALDQPWPAEPTVSERQQSVLATIDREQLEARLGWLRDYREAIERWSQWHEVIQVVVRHVRRHGIERDTVATLRGRLAKLNLLPSAQAAAEAMIGFVADQATVLRPGVERLIASTEILESLFGNLKNLEQQQSGSGLTGLMLAMGAMVSTWTDQEIDKAFRATPLKAVETWIDNHLGPTVQSQRGVLQAIFSAESVTKAG
jgi:hypothetical protein